jgi:hypothetical protein
VQKPSNVEERSHPDERSGRARVYTSDVEELIRICNRLHERSNAVQRAASRASAVLQDVLRRSVEVCGR